jgi:hypothetical protein
VGREYGELDGAAPGVRREDGADVFVARAPFRNWGARRAIRPVNEGCAWAASEECAIVP